jgi:hypothetical protein
MDLQLDLCLKYVTVSSDAAQVAEVGSALSLLWLPGTVSKKIPKLLCPRCPTFPHTVSLSVWSVVTDVTDVTETNMITGYPYDYIQSEWGTKQRKISKKYFAGSYCKTR